MYSLNMESLSDSPSESLNAVERTVIYFIASLKVDIFVFFSLGLSIFVLISGIERLRVSKASLISRILDRSLAFAVFLRYLLKGRHFCFDDFDILLRGFRTSSDTSSESVDLGAQRGRREYPFLSVELLLASKSTSIMSKSNQFIVSPLEYENIQTIF